MCATFTLLLLRRTIKDIEKRYQWCNCVLCIPYHIIQLIVSTLSTQSFHHFLADNHQEHINQWFCLCPIFYRQCAIDRNSLTMFCDASQYATVYLQSMVSSSASTRHVLLPPLFITHGERLYHHAEPHRNLMRNFAIACTLYLRPKWHIMSSK